MPSFDVSGEISYRFRHRIEVDSEEDAWKVANELTSDDVQDGADAEEAVIFTVVAIEP